MANTIWKFPLKIEDRQTISMPVGAKILTCQTQGGKPFLWALVNSELETADRYIAIVGTGNPIAFEESELKYISTIQIYNGDLVFHVFEKI